jgi:DNA-binding GntR family transcriptional regulator
MRNRSSTVVSLSSRIRRERLVDQVTEELRNQIISGGMPPGSPLAQEEISRSFGVSRTPLREAFRTLERDGLLEIQKNGAVKVSQFSDEDIAELYEVRVVMDGLAARLSSQRHDEGRLARLEDLAKSIDRFTRPFKPTQFVEAHAAFHLTIVELAGSRQLTKMQSVFRISTHMLAPRLQTNTRRMIESAREHHGILNAISAGDAELAERLARDHIRSARESWTPQSPAPS